MKTYLETQHSPATAKRYHQEITKYQTATPQAATATQAQVMAYLSRQRKAGKKDLKVILSAIKKYYDYQVSIENRSDHPAKNIQLKDKSKEIQHQDLFTTAELEKLTERQERYPILKNRNKLIITLLTTQALTTGEITTLTIEDINLEQATIKIKAGRKTNGRTLKLTSQQVYIIMNYLNQDRPKLLKTKPGTKPENTNKLIITKTGKPEKGEAVSAIIESQKHQYPERKLNPKTIRQSVIANHLKAGKDLRIVQAFAGHKYPSSTEKYKSSDEEELKKEVLKYHPLG